MVGTFWHPSSERLAFDRVSAVSSTERIFQAQNVHLLTLGGDWHRHQTLFRDSHI
jgi:hypothetical protein